MGDRCWAKIQIGGRLPKSKLPAFKKALNDYVYMEKGKDIIKDNLVGDPGYLEFEDQEVNYASFGFEKDLRKLGLTYYKENSAGSEYESGYEYWEPGMDDPKCSVNANGNEAIGANNLLGMIEKVEQASNNLSDLPIHINDEDEEWKFIAEYYFKNGSQATPLGCIKTYVQNHIVPSEVPPFEIVKD